MSYADGLLTKGERVVHREKQHWWVFVWGAKVTILATILALVFLIVANGLQPSDPESIIVTVKQILVWVAVAVFLAGIALLIWTTLRYINQEYVLTNRRVIESTGVVNKRVVDSSLEKINDAVLTQSIWGRMFGFGHLKVLTASEAAISEFRMLRRPIEFKKAMLEAKHEYEVEIAGGDYQAPPAPPIRTEPTPPPSAAVPPPTSSLPPQAPVAAPAAAVPAAAPAPPVAASPTDPTVIAATPGGTAPLSAAAADSLADLTNLRDTGAISVEEFERRKAELIDRL